MASLKKLTTGIILSLIFILVVGGGILFFIVHVMHKTVPLQVYKAMKQERDYYALILEKSRYYSQMSDIIWGKESRRCDAGLVLYVDTMRKVYAPEVSLDDILSLITIESGFNKYAVSRAGAMGIMQILPSTAREIDSTIVSNDELFNEQKNIKIGLIYLSKLIRKFDGNTELAILAYNRGPVRIITELTNKNLPKDYFNKIEKYKSR